MRRLQCTANRHPLLGKETYISNCAITIRPKIWRAFLNVQDWPSFSDVGKDLSPMLQGPQLAAVRCCRDRNSQLYAAAGTATRSCTLLQGPQLAVVRCCRDRNSLLYATAGTATRCCTLHNHCSWDCVHFSRFISLASLHWLNSYIFFSGNTSRSVLSFCDELDSILQTSWSTAPVYVLQGFLCSHQYCMRGAMHHLNFSIKELSQEHTDMP